MKPLVVSLMEEGERSREIADRIGGELAELDLRQFPDGETYIRFLSEVSGRDVVVHCGLDAANSTVVPLLLVAETLRDLDARKIGLAAPYLGYMRQDERFYEGEGVTSRYFARMISRAFDWLVTVDPHLHRYSSLDEVYSIPSRVVRSAGAIAAWINEEVEEALLVGPDAESRQWVAAVAKAGDFPTVILEKSRHGDYDVEVTGPGELSWSDKQPVIIDDIISTGRTMVEAARYLAKSDLKPPISVGIHGLFVADGLEYLLGAGVERIVTCNTVFHETNGINITGEFAEGIAEMLDEQSDS